MMCRLGLRVSHENRRDPAGIRFIPNFNAYDFYRLFEQLAPTACKLTAKSIHDRHWFAQRVYCYLDTNNWYQLAADAYVTGTTYDYCVCTAHPITKPAAICEAERLARRIATPYQDARTRQAFPERIERITRRSMWLRGRRECRIDFDIVQVYVYALTDTGLGIQYALINKPTVYWVTIHGEEWEMAALQLLARVSSLPIS